MKIQLIILPNQPILVSDEEFEEGYSGPIVISTRDKELINKPDFVVSTKMDALQGKILNLKDNTWVWCDEGKKIIAGFPDLPKINFSALSEEDCKKIGWIDVRNLAHKAAHQKFKLTHIPLEEIDEYGGEILTYIQNWVDGFKAAQLNEKKYSLEDIEKAWEYGIDEGKWKKGDPLHLSFSEFIESLSQPKVFDVLIETENPLKETITSSVGSGGRDIIVSFDKPKIINNSIKIIKVL